MASCSTGNTHYTEGKRTMAIRAYCLNIDARLLREQQDALAELQMDRDWDSLEGILNLLAEIADQEEEHAVGDPVEDIPGECSQHSPGQN